VVSTMMIRYGKIGRLTSAMETFPTPQATSRQRPGGGRMKPTPRLAMARIEKWIGSIPSFSAEGRSRGISRMIAGAPRGASR